MTPSQRVAIIDALDRLATTNRHVVQAIDYITPATLAGQPAYLARSLRQIEHLIRRLRDEVLAIGVLHERILDPILEHLTGTGEVEPVKLAGPDELRGSMAERTALLLPPLREFHVTLGETIAVLAESLPNPDREDPFP